MAQADGCTRPATPPSLVGYRPSILLLAYLLLADGQPIKVDVLDYRIFGQRTRSRGQISPTLGLLRGLRVWGDLCIANHGQRRYDRRRDYALRLVALPPDDTLEIILDAADAIKRAYPAVPWPEIGSG